MVSQPFDENDVAMTRMMMIDDYTTTMSTSMDLRPVGGQHVDDDDDETWTTTATSTRTLTMMATTMSTMTVTTLMMMGSTTVMKTIF